MDIMSEALNLAPTQTGSEKHAKSIRPHNSQTWALDKLKTA